MISPLLSNIYLTEVDRMLERAAVCANGSDDGCRPICLANNLLNDEPRFRHLQFVLPAVAGPAEMAV